MYSGPQDTRVLTGVMDQDSAAWAVAPENYRYALNLIDTYQNSLGSKASVKGTTLTANPLLASGRNKVIGSYEDLASNTIIYFVWNEYGYHGIYRWYADFKVSQNGYIEEVFKITNPSMYDQYNPNPFNFQENNLITGRINLVDDLLYWTDGFNDPKYINIKRANETNKRRTYNLYLNSLSFSTTTTYTINVYLYGTLSDTVSITSSSANLFDRVNDVYNGMQVLSVVTSENKTDHVHIECNLPGKYYIEILESTFNASEVIPENFYPDYTGAIGYPPLSGYIFNQIKNPPFTPVLADYILDPQQYFQIDLEAISNSFNGNTSSISYLDGFIGKVNDINNNVVLGPTTSVINAVGPPTIPLSANITNLPAGNYTFNLNANFSISVTGGVYAYSLTIALGKYATPLAWNAATLPIIYTYSNSFNTTQSINVNANIANVLPTDNIVLFITISRSGPASINTTFNFDGTLSGSINPELFVQQRIAGESYLFRAKYIYDNYENSVYGAISKLPLATDFYKNKSINVNYDDKWLNKIDYKSTIQNVVLALSQDNGATWFNFEKLDPYEFMCNGTRNYTFKDEDSLIAIPSSEAILQYHAIANRVGAQEYIDNRIFHADLEEGYDKVIADIEYTIKYDNKSALTQYEPYISSHGWKYGYRGYVAIVYYDDSDRKCGATLFPDSKIEIPFYNDTLFANLSDGLVPYLSFQINNTPPDYATKYQIVRTKDLVTDNYLSWYPDGVFFYDIDFNPTSTAGRKYYTAIKISNIQYYVENLNLGAKISWTFTQGDRIRIIADSTGATVANDYDTEILAINNDEVIIRYDPTSPWSNSVVVGLGTKFFFEIYTPKKLADENIYYEVGVCYEVKVANVNGKLVKYHAGDIDQNPFTGTGAVVDVRQGGVYYRTRKIPSQSNPFVTTPPDELLFGFISSQEPTEMIADPVDATGRPNIESLPGRTKGYTELRYSDQYVNQQYNQLNVFQPLNVTHYTYSYGGISKLQVTNNDILRILFKNSYQLSIYVNQSVLRQSQGIQNLITTSDTVAGNSHIIQRYFGTTNPESIVINDQGDIFGWDESQAGVWHGTNNGVVCVSDAGMKITFLDYSLRRRELSTPSECPAIYDNYNDLYILTFGEMAPSAEKAPSVVINFTQIESLSFGIKVSLEPQGTIYYNLSAFDTSIQVMLGVILSPYGYTVSSNNGSIIVTAPQYNGYQNSVLAIELRDNITGQATTKSYVFDNGSAADSAAPFSATTLAYSKKHKGWVTYFSFTPEMYGRLRNQIVGFKDGQLYIHNNSQTHNNFYGTQYDSRLRFVMNKDYPKVKVPLSVWYRGTGKWGTIITNVPTASYPYGQETEMTENHFLLEEDGYYSEVLKNRLDPRYPTTDQAWVNGEDIRGDAPEIEFYNKETTASRLDSTKTLYLYSENS